MMGVEWEIGTAGRKGWMDRVEWAGKQVDQVEAVGAIIAKSKLSSFSMLVGCGWMDGGMMLLLLLFLSVRGCGVDSTERQ